MMQSPFPGFTPELLAQIAQASFRPPGPAAVPGMQMPQQGGMGIGDGLAGLGMGLSALYPTAGRTPNGDPNDNRPYMTGGVDPRLIDPLTGQPRTGLLGPV